jgi:hypothetical protein
MLLRKLSRDNRNPKGIILNINKIRHANSRVYSAKADKDCHEVLKTNTRQNGPKAADNIGNLIRIQPSISII